MDTQSESPISSELIDMYLAGRLEECSTSQQEEIRRWLEGSNGVANLESIIQTMSVDSPVTHHDEHSIDEQWARIEKKLDSRHVASGTVRPWLKYGVAAVVAVLAMLYTPMLVEQRQVKSKVRTYGTRAGERAKVRLPDGSSVVLAPETELRYAESFGYENRTVELHGQALFTVAHQGRPPFIVNTGNTSTRVLGTTFSVRAYGNLDETRVVVAEGKVAANNTVLSTGDGAVIRNGGTTVSHNIDISSAFAWTAGRLDFRNETFGNVLVDVNRTFAVNFGVADSIIAQRRLTVSIQKMPRETLVALLADLSNTLARERGGKVTFISTQE